MAAIAAAARMNSGIGGGGGSATFGLPRGNRGGGGRGGGSGGAGRGRGSGSTGAASTGRGAGRANRGGAGSSAAVASSSGASNSSTSPRTASRGQYSQVNAEDSGTGGDPPGGLVSQAERAILANVGRWMAPLVAVLVALMLQTTGLCAGTRGYVQQMDQITWVATMAMEEKFHEAIPVNELEKSVKPEIAFGPFGAAVRDVPKGRSMRWPVLEHSTALLPLAWLLAVLARKDLRHWTHTLLAVALLATLKGFLAWATVVPDASGWSVCKERLGADGLDYYRRLAAGEGSQSLELLFDHMALTIRGVFDIGKVERDHYCVDTAFSSSTCYAVLFSAALQDIMRWTKDHPPGMKRFWTMSYYVTCAVTGVFTVMNVFVDFMNPYHYISDVFMALILALGIYGNPAVAISSKMWSTVKSPWQAAMVTLETTLSMESETPGDDKVLQDAGHVTVPMCCFPFMPHVFHLRSQPNNAMPRPKINKALRNSRQRLAELGQVTQEVQRQRRELEEQLEQERSDARRREEQAKAKEDARFKELLNSTRQRLEMEGSRMLRDAETRLENERQKAVKLEERVMSEMERYSAAEVAFDEERRTLAEEAKRAHGEAQAAKRAAEEEEERLKQAEAIVAALQQDLVEVEATTAVAGSANTASDPAVALPAAADAS